MGGEDADTAYGNGIQLASRAKSRIVRLAVLNGAAGFVHLICTIVGDNKYKFSNRYTNDDLGVEVLDLMWTTAILAEMLAVGGSWLWFMWPALINKDPRKLLQQQCMIYMVTTMLAWILDFWTLTALCVAYGSTTVSNSFASEQRLLYSLSIISMLCMVIGVPCMLQALSSFISEAIEEFDDQDEEIDLENLAIEIAPVSNNSKWEETKWEEPSAPGYYPQNQAHAHAQPVNDLTYAVGHQTGYEYDDEGYEGGMATAPVLPPIDMTPMAAAIPHHGKTVQAVPVVSESYDGEWSNIQGYGGSHEHHAHSEDFAAQSSHEYHEEKSSDPAAYQHSALQNQPSHNLKTKLPPLNLPNSFTIDGSYTIEAPEFEQWWEGTPESGSFNCHIKRVPSHDEISRHVTSVGFYVVAAGSLQDSVKIYFAGKRFGPDSVRIFGEFIFTYSTCHLQATLKCEDPNLTTEFVKLFHLQHLVTVVS